MSNRVPMIDTNTLHGQGSMAQLCPVDEYSKSMAVMLVAINKRYIIGIMVWLDADPELAKRDQELEQHISQVWTDGLSIQRFQEVLREYYRFWLKVIRDYKGRNKPVKKIGQ